MINGIVNTPTSPPGPPPSPTTERTQPPYPPSPPHHIQDPMTSPPPRQRTILTSIPSPRDAPTPMRSRTPRYDTDGVGRTRRGFIGILLLTGIPNEI